MSECGIPKLPERRPTRDAADFYAGFVDATDAEDAVRVGKLSRGAA